MDVRQFAVEETKEITLLDAADNVMLADGGPCIVTVYGPGTKQYNRAQAANTNRMVDKIKKKGKTDQSDEERKREQAEFLVGCTKSFSANIQYDELKDEALWKAVYTDPSIGFIAEQVAKFLGDWSNFTKASTTS